MPSTDFDLNNFGSIVVIYAADQAANDWTEANITEDEPQWWCHGSVVEPRLCREHPRGDYGRRTYCELSMSIEQHLKRRNRRGKTWSHGNVQSARCQYESVARNCA